MVQLSNRLAIKINTKPKPKTQNKKGNKMKTFRESFQTSVDNINESEAKWQAIIKKASKEIERLTYREDPVIEAFYEFMDVRYSSEKEAIKSLQNLGTFEFQNSPSDKWDEEGMWGDEFANVTWGDLANLTMADINQYNKKKANGISKEKFNTVKNHLEAAYNA
jgi:hypothetical protein